jgi:hypothetical protein
MPWGIFRRGSVYPRGIAVHAAACIRSGDQIKGGRIGNEQPPCIDHPDPRIGTSRKVGEYAQGLFRKTVSAGIFAIGGISRFGGIKTAGKGGGKQASLLYHGFFLGAEELFLEGSQKQYAPHGKKEDQYIKEQQPETQAVDQAEFHFSFHL